MELQAVPLDIVLFVVGALVVGVLASKLVRVWMDISEAKKLQKQETLQPLLGVVSPNIYAAVEQLKKADAALEEAKKQKENLK